IRVIDRSDSAGVAHLQTNLFTNNESAIVERDSRINTRQRTNPNLFENNVTAVLSTGVPDVRFNWWNSPTGPTTPANPGGTGDVINGGARFRPFLTTRPDTTDRPPVVRMPRAPYAETGLLDAGKKILLHWDASDDRGIVKQKILFSRESLLRSSFTVIADNLPPSQRSFEFTVPTVGFVQSGSEQFIRIVAVDEKGQEGFDDWMPLIPAGDPRGELIITSDVAGRTFRGGDEIPFTTQTTVGFDECSMSNYLIFDADRKLVSLGVNTIVILPPISTDTARLMRVCSRTYNQQKYFFSEPFAIRHDPRFPDAPPQVTLTSPAAGQQFAAGDAVPLTWTATDDEAIRHFNIQSSSDNGRTWIQIAEQLPPTTTSYNWQPFVRGDSSDVRIRVIAVDRRFQNSSSTRSINFVAPPNAPPTVQVTFPANGATYTVGQSTFIAADAADPDGEIQRVEFYAKSGSPISDPAFIGSDTTAPYQVPWTYPLAQGYIITASAFDNRNQMTTSAPINVTFNPFNPAPLPIARPELTNPVDGATFPASANITLEGLPAPTHRTIVRVEFFNGTTLVGTDTTAPYSLTLNNLPEGQYTFFVKSVADNNAEAVSPLSDVTVLGASNQPPSVQMTSPVNGSSFNQPASITIAVDATDADGSVAKVDFYSGQTLLGTDTTAPYQYVWDSTAGEYSLTAVATDNLSAATTSAAVAVTVVDQSGGAPAGLQYYPLAHPVRLLDTRPGEVACFTPETTLAADSTLALVARGTCNGLTIPASAKAVVGNATVVNTDGEGDSGFITLSPSGAARPTVSNLNYSPEQVVPNSFTVGLGASDGAFQIYATSGINFIVDVTGYYSDQAVDTNGPGLLYHPLPSPVRLLDTRAGEPACDTPGAPLTVGGARTEPARTACSGIPEGAQVVVGNATVVNHTIENGNGFVTLFP
ncbi:MAG: Ig-like domain-containing protein, partial [Acidobacteriota bacterium]|nr:Ig-like domain-containing protein [Acidobacteriota bacterium]